MPITFIHTPSTRSASTRARRSTASATKVAANDKTVRIYHVGPELDNSPATEKK